MKLNVKLEIDGVGTITEYKGVTMEYLLNSLKGFQSSATSNEIQGTKGLEYLCYVKNKK